MKKSRVIIAGAGALAITVGVSLALRFSRTPEAPHVDKPQLHTHAATSASIPEGSQSAKSQSVASIASPSVHSTLLAMMNDDDPEFVQIKKNEIDLFLLLAKDLPVDEATANELADTLARARAAQLLYQGTIATIVPESSERTRVEVPAYPAEGMALMDFVNQRLVRALPSTTSVAEFWEKGDSEFSFLGRHSQSLVFKRDADARRNNAVKITATMQVDESGLTATSNSTLGLNQLGSFAVYSGAIPE